MKTIAAIVLPALVLLAPAAYAAKLATNRNLCYWAVDRLHCAPRATYLKCGMLLIEDMSVEHFHYIGNQVAAVLADNSQGYHSYHNLKPRREAIMLDAVWTAGSSFIAGNKAPSSP